MKILPVCHCILVAGKQGVGREIMRDYEGDNER
jgi:hypothetical protein